MPPVFGRNFQSALLFALASPSSLQLRGYHPLRRPVPRDFMSGRSGGPRPHISMRLTRTDSACPVPFSIAFTHGISFDTLLRSETQALLPRNTNPLLWFTQFHGPMPVKKRRFYLQQAHGGFPRFTLDVAATDSTFSSQHMVNEC
jgi:hypothetical protein